MISVKRFDPAPYDLWMVKQRLPAASFFLLFLSSVWFAGRPVAHRLKSMACDTSAVTVRVWDKGAEVRT